MQSLLETPNSAVPEILRCATDGERIARLKTCQDVAVFDSLEAQLRDLLRARHPARRLTESELRELTLIELESRPIAEYGVWVFYPWSRRLVHLLDEPDFVELRTNRNCYKITPEEQKTLATRRVGVVGLSVGQSVSLALALERSFGELRLADFDSLDLSN